MIKKNIAVVKGVQSTRYDKWLSEFVEPGDSLCFTEEELSKQTASNAAKRLTLLDSKGEGRKFHSFYDVIEKLVVIRVRPAGEVPERGDSDSGEEEKKVASLGDFLNGESEQPTEQPTEQETEFQLD